MDRFCAQCGAVLLPGRSTRAVYCSGKCRAAAKRERDRIATAINRFHQDKATNDLLQKFSTFAPETAARLNEFVTVYGGECAEAAIKLALAAYQEARRSAA